MSRLLIVEDEKHLADGLRFNLEAEGYRVEIVRDGESALALLGKQPDQFDAIVLDVMLPGIDGFAVASQLRQAGQFLPILMLTARGRAEDVLRGFEAGADDYLPKPFELSILMARLHSLLRRRKWSMSQREHLSYSNNTKLDQNREAARSSSKGNRYGRALEPTTFHFDGRTIDFDALEIRVEDRVIPLTLMEAELLQHLVRHAGKSVSRKSILEEVWGLHEDTDTRAIDNFIVRLRKYIEVEPSRPKFLLTVRGVGYRFIPSSSAPEKS